MARAAFHLYGAGDEGNDLRVPVAYAVVELYGAELPDEEAAMLVQEPGLIALLRKLANTSGENRALTPPLTEP